VIEAYFFYIRCSAWNRFRMRLRRVRQPKYLVSILAGIGYLALVFRPGAFWARQPSSPLPLTPEVIPAVEAGAAVGLLLFLILPWIWPGRGGGLAFTEAEIQFLFPAPLSRRSLLGLRIWKGQAGILIGVFLSVFLFGRGQVVAQPIFLLIALWVLYSFLAAYRLGTTLVKTSLAEHGTAGFRRHFPAVGVMSSVLLSLLVWWRWYVPPIGAGEDAAATGLLRWFVSATESGPVLYLLEPLRWLIRPALAKDWPSFIRQLAPALALLGLAYAWVIRSDVRFEEASVARARKVAARLERAGSGGRTPVFRSRRLRQVPFPLRASGPAYTAIVWKNLISVGRWDLRRLLPAAVAITLVLSVLGARQGAALAAGLGVTAALMSGFLTIMGPMLLRDDLRTDLIYVDQLKGYPVPGWSVVLGEVMAPTLVLALPQWLLLAAAAFLIPHQEARWLTADMRLAVVSSLALLLPCVTFVGVLAQNAAALLLPSWVQLGKQHPRGIEAMGQRLIVLAGVLLVLVCAVFPAALFALPLLWLGHWPLGIGAFPLAALAAALVIAAESFAAIVILGRAFEGFDPSLELDSV